MQKKSVHTYNLSSTHYIYILLPMHVHLYRAEAFSASLFKAGLAHKTMATVRQKSCFEQ